MSKPDGAIWESHFRIYEHKKATLNKPPYREGTEVPCFPINFTLADGGMGDYICWMAAIVWVAEECPFVHGRVFAPAFFIEFARSLMRKYPHWKVSLVEKIAETYEENSLVLGPGINGHQQLLNAVGTHLLDLGFAYFGNISPPPPEYYHYPEFSFSRETLPKKLRHLEQKYVVLTPGGTTPTRQVPGRAWNPIAEHIRSKGLLPVFLGKNNMTKEHKAIFPEGTDYGLGLDLRDQTTTLEAAAIMQHSECTVGLDNGLLHLAACVPGNIIFAYNIAAPSQRRPVRRLPGQIIDIVLSEEELACNFCQTRMKHQNLINFRNCFYGDLKCLGLLFADESKRFRDALDKVLANQPPNTKAPPAGAT